LSASAEGVHVTDTDPAALAADLVARPSENPPGDERAAAEYLHGWLDERGVDADLVTAPDPDRPQVAARVGAGEPTVVLNGHLDVVPAGDRDEWTSPPFEPTTTDGRLVGRGAADMNSGVAVAAAATVEFAERFAAGEADGSVVLHAAMGEETAEPGTLTLLERGYDGDYGVVLEPTGLRTATSEKGLAWYEITVAGEPAHASVPDEGRNAILEARPVLDALAAYDDRVRERTDPLVGSAYATVTGFDAGTKENVVAEAATITVDRRFLPAESAAEIDAEIDGLLADVAAEHGIETDWTRTRTYESAAVPVDCDLADRFRSHSARIADAPTEPWGIPASTDVRNLVNDAGMEAITWGPGALSQAHTYDESIALAEIDRAHETLIAALADLFGD
jgi:succinyl-diaminopimelate desuccinylase